MTVLPVECVQDYPRPPAIEPVALRLRVEVAGVTLADSEAAFRVLETHHSPSYYIPQSDILMSLLVPSSRQTFCEWKGRAAYFDIVVNGKRRRNAGWCYPAPTARFDALKDHISFYAGSVDAAWVGDLKVAAQPGDFYGGWVTPNLSGRIKGLPGTTHW